MQNSLDSLEKGHQFEPATFTLSDDWVSEYSAAVGDKTTATIGQYAPAASLAALSIRALLERSELPAGSIHVGQELSFSRPSRIGETLTVSAQIMSRGERQGWVLMGLSLAVSDTNGSSVMDGRATITFPVGTEGEG